MPLTVEIHLLGEFCLKVDGCETELSAHSYQLWNLLGYLIVFRRREIPHTELIRMLWPDDSIDHPSNALKNLVYRIRTNLAKKGHPLLRSMISYSKGKYTLNPEFEYHIDSEQFEDLCQRAQRPDISKEERIALYFQVFALYRGDFFPELTQSHWLIPLQVYYHQLYVTAMGSLLALLEEDGRYQEIVSVCKKAIPLDQMEEGFHRAYIRALVQLGTPDKALDYYDYVTGLFYNELGVTPSDSMKELYLKITDKVNYVEQDLRKIIADLTRQQEQNGAFYCEYSVFQHIFELLLRSVERTGSGVYLALLTLTDLNGGIPRVQMLSDGMPQLQKILCQSLRKGDVYCKYSKSQWAALLVLPDSDAARSVEQRLHGRFDALPSPAQLCLRVSFQAVPQSKGVR